MGNSLTSLNLEEMQKAAEEVAGRLKAGDVVCLRGDLGAGKTTFSKGIISSLLKEIDIDDITSPTFITMNLYENIAHFDLYRLENRESFLLSGFEEYLEDPYIAIIEWPEIIEDLLPESRIDLTIEVDGSGMRKIHETV